MKFEQKWLNGPDGRICYFLSREFNGRPTLIFLHGLSANHSTWLEMAEKLESLKVNFILPDLRGHGHSDKTKNKNLYELAKFTQDLRSIIAQEEIDRPILIGYSFGGYVALDYAIKYPDSASALILISTNHINPLHYRMIGFLAKPARLVLDATAFLLLWQKRKNYYYYNQKKDLGYWRSAFKGLLTMPLSVNFWMIGQGLAIDFRGDLNKIIIPTLLLKSKDDPFVSGREAEDMKKNIKNSELHIIEANSHYLASRDQKKIVNIIFDFIAKRVS